MVVLGVSISHNGAACIMRDGRVLCAIQEERLTRRKRDRLPLDGSSKAIRYCLDATGTRPADVALIVLCALEDAESAAYVLPRSLRRIPRQVISHHYGHALSAYWSSGFADALVLVADGRGSHTSELSAQERAVAGGDGYEFFSAYSAAGKRRFDVVEKHVTPGLWLDEEDVAPYPRFSTLGGLYSAASVALFDDVTAAGKVMGLAPYGRSDGARGAYVKLANGRFVFGTVRRSVAAWASAPRQAADHAACIQADLEDVLLQKTLELKRLTGARNLCLAGGVALNGIANDAIVRRAGFEDVFIVPAAEDSGPALGAAYFGTLQLGGLRRTRLRSDSLGRAYGRAEVLSALRARRHDVDVSEPARFADRCAALLADGAVVAFFQSGSEFGPRALGNRSLLADPRRPDVARHLNLDVKGREPFRPFGASVLEDDAAAWFDLHTIASSPFMMRVVDVLPHRRSAIPAVVHVDGTCRPQTVTRRSAPALHAVLTSFRRRTGVPLLLNTSLNVAGEPLVETPAEALSLLLSTDVDYLAIDRFIVRKADGEEAVKRRTA